MQFTDVVTAVIVGNEVLLRGELPEAGLREAIRSAKGRVKVPVSYADTWDFWLRYPELGHEVDFVTINVLPYWEDVPPRAEDAPRHVIDARSKVALAEPPKRAVGFIDKVNARPRSELESTLAHVFTIAALLSTVLRRAQLCMVIL